jgi:ankyrin repeat protein
MRTLQEIFNENANGMIPALALAARQGNTHIVGELLRRGADPGRRPPSTDVQGERQEPPVKKTPAKKSIKLLRPIKLKTGMDS